jgi:SAM domain (Sterile alpha motif)
VDLAGWLRSLGLEQHEAAFRENAIDETVLPDLTEAHLRELGFPLGTRLKLLKAIAALKEGAEPIGPPASSASAESPADLSERGRSQSCFAIWSVPPHCRAPSTWRS